MKNHPSGTSCASTRGSRKKIHEACQSSIAPTVRPMSKRTPTPLLRPRDYALPDHKFGTTAPISWTVPAGGDELSRRLAELQHKLIVAVATRPDPQAALSRRPRKDPTDRTAAMRMCRRWSFSRSWYQAASRGDAFFHVAGLAAVVELLFLEQPHP